MHIQLRIALCSQLLVAAACGSKKETAAKTDPEADQPSHEATARPSASARPSAEELSPLDKLRNAPTLEEALKLVTLNDSANAMDPGTAQLAIWASDHLEWSDVSGESNTSTKLIMKDPDAERGKHECWSGSIIEIHTEKTALGKFYHGGLMTPGQQVITFIAVRDTGEIVESSIARICGIVTGLHDYSNSAGGTTHAIQIVGLFDLPPNHEPLPKKPSLKGTTIDLGK